MDKVQKIAIDWSEIDTVLLDMDGTLLDLHFDNYFWQIYIPQVYAVKHEISLQQSAALLTKLSKQQMGKLNWYCLDYWSEQLSLDVVALKNDLADKIQFRPNTMAFLERMKQIGKRLILATNAHPKAIELKLLQTDFSQYFDALSSSHTLGHPKEEQQYWHLLSKQFQLDKERCLFIDDSLSVLASAQTFGIAHLLAVTRPDMQKSSQDPAPYTGIDDFIQLL
ncbi:MAG: GMP/IMP nucleotidase [Enterobacterales bacterium]|nr:GMP/IMP nucleotidase [Enterobacterales bacterium]